MALPSADLARVEAAFMTYGSKALLVNILEADS